MTNEPKPLTEEELARWAKEWQATVYRNRGPAFVAEAQFGLRLIAEVRGLRDLIKHVQPFTVGLYRAAKNPEDEEELLQLEDKLKAEVDRG
jgi:hypothetical protein